MAARGILTCRIFEQSSGIEDTGMAEQAVNGGRCDAALTWPRFW
jgi:hypothetical protein